MPSNTAEDFFRQRAQRFRRHSAGGHGRPGLAVDQGHHRDLGGTTTRTGAPGVTAAQIEAFFADLTAYTTWVEQSGTKDIAVLGDATAAACNAIKAVRPKIEDYFARCRMAAFDPRAIAALNRSETEYLAFAAKDLKLDVRRRWPISPRPHRVQPAPALA
jgi:hypothetical protein